MDNTLDQEEYAKNIYVIKHKLSELKPINGSRWEYSVGNFTVHMYPYEIGDVPRSQMNSPVRHDKLSVVVNEKTKAGSVSSICLRDDSRFKNYEPIQYDVIETPSGKINVSNGDNMPILQLCELIRYLHRLSNLTAFM
jgi:hypothetical protein